MAMKELGVYVIHCTENDTYYVGETANKKCSRYLQHLNYLKQKKGYSE